MDSTAGLSCANGETNGLLAGREDFINFKRHAGSVCTHMQDYKEYAGTLSVTARVRVGVDYVLDPLKEQSVEVTNFNGHSLTYNDNGLSRDRITVVDCSGTCGVSGPTAAVSVFKDGMVHEGSAIDTWNNFFNANNFVDQLTPEQLQAQQEQVSTPDNAYVKFENKYCPNTNLDLEGLMVSIGGTMQDLQRHQCYTKCTTNAPCTDVDCFCDGHLNGYDTRDSNALCLPEDMIAHFCNQLPSCRGYEIHRDRPRGYLNGDGCQSNTALLGDSPNYDYAVKQNDGVDQGTVTAGPITIIDTTDVLNQADPDCEDTADWVDSAGVGCTAYEHEGWCQGGTFFEATWSSSRPRTCGLDAYAVLGVSAADACCSCGGGTNRRLQAAINRGHVDTVLPPIVQDTNSWMYSWRQMLRFQGMIFTSGGTFKLCFCDSDHLSTLAGPSARACQHASDYDVEVGTIHVSGIGCLLKDARFQRVTCAAQLYGGMRCYAPPVAAPVYLAPPRLQDSLSTSLVLESDVAEPVDLTVWCGYGPSEATSVDARCQLVRRFS